MIYETVRPNTIGSLNTDQQPDLLDTKVVVSEKIKGQLSSERDYQSMSAVLLSLRRITALLRTSRGVVNSPSYTKPHTECANIKEDLASFCGIDLTDTEILRALRDISGLEEACIPLAERATRLAGFKTPLDTDELGWFAGKGVERAIWDIWNPPALEDAPSTLVKLVNAYLFHLPEYANRQVNYGLRRGRMQSLESFGEDANGNTIRPWDERLQIPDQDTVFSTVHDKGSFGKAIEAWYPLVRGMTLAEVFHLISQLGLPQKIAILDYFHYVSNPSMERTARLRSYGMSRTTYERHFVEGINSCISYLDDQGSIPSRSLVSISDIIHTVGHPTVHQMSGRALHYDSPRIALAQAAQEGTLVRARSSLTQSQQKMAEYAITLCPDGVTFQYSNAEIAKMMGVSESTVGESLAKALKIWESGDVRCVSRPSKNGSIIQPESNHAKLIRMSGALTNIQRASLTRQMLTVLDLLTVPDEHGVYPRYEDVRKKVRAGNKSMLGDLCHLLTNTGWVTTLRDQVSCALNGDKQKFTLDEIKLLTEMGRRIEEGEPVRSRSRYGPAWTETATQLNIPSYKGQALAKKLGRLYGELG